MPKKKAPPPPQYTTKRGNGRAVLAGVDGRTNMARRFREIITQVEEDLGGDLTEAQYAILARAATLACWAEERESELARGEPFDVGQYSAAANAMRRLLNDLGLQRVGRDVTNLDDWLTARAKAVNDG